MTLSGSPAIKRCEASINNTWGAGGPDAGVGTDNFSVRWSGMHTFETGDYLFTATSDDGIRVWVDGQLIIDGWGDHPPTTYRATPTMTAGDHQVRVEYYENSGGATAQLSWQMLGPKVVALTFDDGPDPAHTPKILDTLQQHNVKATFFVLGHWVTQYPDLVRREFQEGHVVGNHSYSHNNLTTLSAAEVEQDLRMTNQAITAAGVPQPNLFRPPGGITNGAVESTVSSLGMTQTLWAVDAYDTVNPVPSTQLCDRVVSGVSPGSIVVMHDGGSLYTADALDCIITRLKAQGYTFAQVYPSSTYNTLNSSYVEIR
jgi:peptidoglycan/xylan/chitin deacetylase (PgdA/CDA1 family)